MSDTTSLSNEAGKRQAVCDAMMDPNIAQEKQAEIQCILSGDNNLPAITPSQNDADVGDFAARTGHVLPPMLASLGELLRNDRAVKILGYTLDANIDDEIWASAYDVEDNFGFDLTGANEVIRVASQGTGSIFGLLVGMNNSSDEDLEMSTPVVFIDSEGSAARVAPNLKSFWRTLLSLNCFYSGVLSYIGTSVAQEGEPTDEEIEVIRSRVLDRIRVWRQTQADAGDEVPQEDLQWLADLLGVTMVSDAEAVNEMFDCDFALPRWRPRPLDEENCSNDRTDSSSEAF